MSRRPTIFRKGDLISNPPKRQYYNNNFNNNNNYNQQQLSSNYQRLMRDGVDVFQNNNILDEKQDQYKNIFSKRTDVLNDYYSNKNGNK